MAKELFGRFHTGQEVFVYTLENKNGMTIKLIEYGATLISIKVPAGLGQKVELNIGFDTLEDYINQKSLFGATVGRYANRIANGTFDLDGRTYHLDLNRPPHHLHGGTHGFGRVLWNVEKLDKNSITFSYESPDGDQGYPGKLKVKSIYELTDANEIKLIYEAVTDKTTPINLTNHAYFNLAGAGSGDVYGHEVQIIADRIVEVDESLIPTGHLKDVKDTYFDLTYHTNLGEAIKKTPKSFGFDFCYVSSDKPISPLKFIAKVKEPKSGRAMEVYTTQPGVQFYTANFIERMPIANGKMIDKHGGLCLETQTFPDGPNHKNFPEPFLRPGEKYHHETVYKFIF